MKTVLVLFGGKSTEHDISRRSVMTVLKSLNNKLYHVIKVGITKEGMWLLHQGDDQEIISDTWHLNGVRAILSPEVGTKNLLVFEETGLRELAVDVVIPVLHGLHGEDGTMQGLFKLANLPFVGCGVLASAIAMDKVYTKQVVAPLGIRQAAYLVAQKEFYQKETLLDEVVLKLGFPVYVKPSNAGSSIGVTRAVDPEALHLGLLEAFKHDRKVLIEENIVGREVECAVLGNLTVEASDVGEIIAADGFYDFEAKYIDTTSKTLVSAQMPETTRQEIREAAIKIFRAIDGRGLSRVDFFIEKATGQVIFNEINTFPGFTNISMYPMLMEASGYDNMKLMDRLIDLAIQRD